MFKDSPNVSFSFFNNSNSLVFWYKKDTDDDIILQNFEINRLIISQALAFKGMRWEENMTMTGYNMIMHYCLGT